MTAFVAAYGPVAKAVRPTPVSEYSEFEHAFRMMGRRAGKSLTFANLYGMGGGDLAHRFPVCPVCQQTVTSLRVHASMREDELHGMLHVMES